MDWIHVAQVGGKLRVLVDVVIDTLAQLLWSVCSLAEEPCAFRKGLWTMELIS